MYLIREVSMITHWDLDESILRISWAGILEMTQLELTNTFLKELIGIYLLVENLTRYSIGDRLFDLNDTSFWNIIFRLYYGV